MMLIPAGQERTEQEYRTLYDGAGLLNHALGASDAAK
ncbi:MAG: hypothetical protein ABI614_16010 [Planctomycetota bacterium]